MEEERTGEGYLTVRFCFMVYPGQERYRNACLSFFLAHPIRQEWKLMVK